MIPAPYLGNKSWRMSPQHSHGNIGFRTTNRHHGKCTKCVDISEMDDIAQQIRFGWAAPERFENGKQYLQDSRTEVWKREK
jgi:hypothetical protein